MHKIKNIKDFPRDWLKSLSSSWKTSQRVVNLLRVSWSLNIEPSFMNTVKRKLNLLISHLRACLQNPSEGQNIIALFNEVMREIGGKHFVNHIYRISPILMKHFVTMPLELQFLYLFAEERGDIQTWAICHHWTVFWHNFWEECKKWTSYEKNPTLMCQVTDDDGKIRFDRHTFCLVDLDMRYILNSDGEKWITMRPARIFSELDHQVYKTVRTKNGVSVEKVHTFRSVSSFGRELDASLWDNNIGQAFLEFLWKKLQQ